MTLCAKICAMVRRWRKPRAPRPTTLATLKRSASATSKPSPGDEDVRKAPERPADTAPEPATVSPSVPSESLSSGTPPGTSGQQPAPRTELAPAQTEPIPQPKSSDVKKIVVSGVLKALELTRDLSGPLVPLRAAATVLIELVETYEVRTTDAVMPGRSEL